MRSLILTLCVFLTSCVREPTPMHDPLTAKGLTELSERHAVTDVLARFADAVSAHDFDAAADLFAENAVWVASAGELSFRHEGREAVRAFFAKNREKIEVEHYSAGAPAVTLLGKGRARSRVALLEVLHLKATGERRMMLGTYTDELALIDGAWRFTNRNVTINHAETLHGVMPRPTEPRTP